MHGEAFPFFLKNNRRYWSFQCYFSWRAFNTTFPGELWLKIVVSCKTEVHDVMLDGKVGWPMEEDRLTGKITNSSCSGSMSSLAT